MDKAFIMQSFIQLLQHLAGLIRKSFPPIHQEGYLFITISCVVTLILMWFGWGWFGIIITAWMVYFFRDPVRTVPQGEGLVVSPADGIVSLIETNLEAPVELGLGEQRFNRVSVFLNVFDVHVNRTPVTGKITKIHYRPGKFLSADLDKASEENERNSLVIETSGGKILVCVQIAGLVARRIVCGVAEQQELEAGDRYGIIRFGSRVDLYLPIDVHPQVIVGQRMIGGETIIASLGSKAGTPAGKQK
jgi:phosphatidylserine decarboxylase